MNVGKKKVKEELDLTQVAEAFGGYIVEARRAKRIPNASGGKKTGSLRGGDIEFPGDRTGATQQAKADIEARKGFKDSKSGGLKDDERNPYVKREVRRSRADDLGGDIEDQPKVTQKDFEKSLKAVDKEGAKIRKARRQAFKDVQTDPVFAGQLEGSKPTFDKKGKKFEKPEDPFKTSKTPIGSAVKNFRFSPRDISTQQASDKVETGLKQAKKSFSQFSRDLQDYRDRDMPGGPKKTKRDRPDITGAGGRNRPTVTGDVETRQDVGMAPPDEPRKQKPESKTKSEPDLSQTEFLDKKTGKRFNMSDPEDRESYLRQQGKEKFIRQAPVKTSERKSGGLAKVGSSEKGGSIVSQSPVVQAIKTADKFVQRNPVLGGVTGLAAYDVGKGIFAKIMKLRGPGVRGGTVGRRSAGSFTAT